MGAVPGRHDCADFSDRAEEAHQVAAFKLLVAKKQRVSMLSLASKQKCDVAADAVAVVYSLIPDVMAEMELEAGDMPTEEEKKKTAKSDSKHTDEPASATLPQRKLHPNRLSHLLKSPILR